MGDLQVRVKLTSSCRDCDVLDRHEKAGQIEIDTDGNKYQYMFNGVKIMYGTYHSPWMNEIITNLNGHHEPQEELCFHYLLETLSSDANMIELGANWAYYSIWFNKLIKTPYNLCIEPVIENLEDGVKNHELNNCTNMEFINGYMGMSDSKNTQFRNWDNRVLTLDRYSISTLISTRNKFFDVVHSDIQGGELDVLNSSVGVLDKIGYFIISTHDNKHKPCLDFLNQNNFTVLVQHSIQESYAADGLILAVNNDYIDKYEKNIDGGLIEFFKKNCNISHR
jgi:FkbM family methyltransferase